MNIAAFSSDEADPGPGNVFEPMPEWNKIDGGWRNSQVRAAVGAGAAAAGLGVLDAAPAIWQHRHG